MGRPKKENVKREPSGKVSRSAHEIHPETLAVRERQLIADGVPLTFMKREMTQQGWREIEKRTAEDRLAGFTLGVLRLRPNGDPGSISEEQFEAGNTFCNIVHRHAAVMGYKLSVPSPSLMAVGAGAAVVEDDQETIDRVRKRFRDCYDALMEQTRMHGKRVWQVTYGVAVENWPCGTLSSADYGHLRVGLNALWKAL